MALDRGSPTEIGEAEIPAEITKIRQRRIRICNQTKAKLVAAVDGAEDFRDLTAQQITEATPPSMSDAERRVQGLLAKNQRHREAAIARRQAFVAAHSQWVADGRPLEALVEHDGFIGLEIV